MRSVDFCPEKKYILAPIKNKEHIKITIKLTQTGEVAINTGLQNSRGIK